MADFTTAGRPDTAGLADRERREVVVQHKRFFVRSLQRVDPLLVLAGAERGDDNCLRLAASEQRRAVGARQKAGLDVDRAHRHEVAAVDPPRGVENVPAHDLGFELFEHAGDLRHRTVGIVLAVREEIFHRLLFDGGDGILALVLCRDRIGLAQVRLDDTKHLFLDHAGVGHAELARLLGRLFGKIDDGIDHRLEVPMAKHHRAKHNLLGQLFGFRFDHQHSVLRASHDEVELAFLHLVDRRIENVFAIGEADARAADRAHERGAGERQCSGRRDHRDDIRIVLLVVRQNGDDDLRIAAPAFGKQRADRAIDQARGQSVLLGRAALALEITAGNAARRVVFFRVVDGKRQEVDAGFRLLGRDNGGDDGGLAVSGNDCAVRLARDLAGFQR